jgi:hypothetical protein
MAKYTAKQFAKVLQYDIPKIPSQASLYVSTEIEKQIQSDFDAGVDPYGKPWAPLAKSTLAKGRFPPPLTDTYKGRSQVRVNPLPGAGVRITSSVAYLNRHQKKAGSRPARPFLPSRVLPTRYLDLYRHEISRWTRRI